jgi:hypothetical protein
MASYRCLPSLHADLERITTMVCSSSSCEILPINFRTFPTRHHIYYVGRFLTFGFDGADRSCGHLSTTLVRRRWGPYWADRIR